MAAPTTFDEWSGAFDVSAADRDVVDYRLVVGVMDHRHVGDVGDVGDRAIVGEGVSRPASAGKANARVAVPIRDTAVEAHMRAPVAGMEDIHAADKPPVTRRP